MEIFILFLLTALWYFQNKSAYMHNSSLDSIASIFLKKYYNFGLFLKFKGFDPGRFRSAV